MECVEQDGVALEWIQRGRDGYRKGSSRRLLGCRVRQFDAKVDELDLAEAVWRHIATEFGPSVLADHPSDGGATDLRLQSISLPDIPTVRRHAEGHVGDPRGEISDS